MFRFEYCLSVGQCLNEGRDRLANKSAPLVSKIGHTRTTFDFLISDFLIANELKTVLRIDPRAFLPNFNSALSILHN